MPKEYAHWYLAERTREALPELSNRRLGSLRAVLDRNLETYLVGAVAPDILFYAKDASALEEAAEAAHGSHGEDTFKGVRAVLQGGTAASEREAASVLACGILTHVMADAVFHPLVWYYSGNSIERHWIFETCMDLYLRKLYLLPNGGLMQRLLRADSLNRRLLARSLSRYFFGFDVDNAALINAALSRHARLQRLFYSPLAAAAIRAAGLLRPGLRRFLGLSYAAQRARSTHSFAGEITFEHPVTCEPRSTTFEALAGQAAAAAVEPIAVLWRSLDAEDPAGELSEMRGPSLETGLTAAKTQEGAPATMICSRPERFDAFLPSE